MSITRKSKIFLVLVLSVAMIIALMPESTFAASYYPGKITSVKASSASNGGITIRWAKKSGVTGYRVYRATSAAGKYTRIKELSGSSSISYTNVSITAGVRYYYKVRAYKTVSGKRYYGKTYSSVVSAKSSVSLATPKLTGAQYSATCNKLTWDKVSGASGYRVYVLEESGSYTRLATVTSTSYSDTKAVTAVKYSYRVRAYRTIKGTNTYSKMSNLAEVTTKVSIARPVATAAQKDAVSNSITWATVKNAYKYTIARAASEDGDYDTLGTSTTTSFVDDTAKSRVTYYYKVAAYAKVKGTVYKSYYSKAASVTTKDIEAPVIAVSQYKVGYNKVTWGNVVGAVKYRVYRATSASGKYSLLKEYDAGSLASAKYATPGKTYYYKVRAKAEDYYSGYSQVVSVKTMKAETGLYVYLACGHGTQTDGSWDPGCVYGKYTEAALMLPITKAMTSAMRRSGVHVYTDSDKNNNLNMIKSVALSNSHSNIKAYVDIHCDYSGAKSGTMPLYYSSSGKVLATALNDAVTGDASLGIGTNGVTRRTDLYALKATNAVACIFETGAIKADLAVLSGKSKAYGEALARGLCAYLGVDYYATSSVN